MGERDILEGQIRGRSAAKPGEPEHLQRADPPAHQVQPHLGCLFCPVPQHGVQAGGPEGLQREEGAGEHGRRALGEIWKERELRAQHFPLSVFLLEEFFSPSADDFTISQGWGEGDVGLGSPPFQMPDSLTFHKKPELQSFLQMRWRLLPSPAPAPSPPVSGPQSWPRRPSQAGRRPQAHSSSHCHAAEIKDTSSGWVPAKRFKSKSGRGGPGPQLGATWKGCLETL